MYYFLYKILCSLKYINNKGYIDKNTEQSIDFVLCFVL